MLGCVGRGTVNKFAEIVAGVVLAGELSLGSAISQLRLGEQPRAVRPESVNE